MIPSCWLLEASPVGFQSLAKTCRMYMFCAVLKMRRRSTQVCPAWASQVDQC